jgi:hypothetical protein
MDQQKTRRTVVLCLVAAAFGAIIWSLMDRPHRDVAGESAQFKLVPEELVLALNSGDSIAALYLNAVVELYAVVDEDDGTRALFEGGVVAVWDTVNPHRALEKGELLRVKGRVTGYDDLFEEVRMDGLVLVDAPGADH